VVAYAIAGTIRFDIEKDVLGMTPTASHDAERPVAERRRNRRHGAASVKPEQFRKVYIPMFDRSNAVAERAEPLYDWRPQSTYIRRPPYWVRWQASALKGMRRWRCSAITSPPTTCRHRTRS
jgi:aconitate hydratase